MRIETSPIEKEIKIPSYPEDSRISHRMFHLIKQNENSYEKHYADFNVLNLVASSVSRDFRVFDLNGNVGIKYLDDVNHEPIYTFFGKNELENTISTLLNQCKIEGISPSLKMIPEETISGKEGELANLFNIEEDVDNFEYLYDLNELGTLKGNKYKNLRRTVNNFHKNNPGQIDVNYYVNVDIKKKSNEFIEVMQNWQATKNLPREEVSRLYRSVERFSKLSEYFSMYNAGLYIDGKLNAFSFNEIIDSDTILSHFAYAKIENKGAMQYFDYQLSKSLANDGFKFLNLQQDLGKPGIRKSKESYNPCGFNRKIKISPKKSSL